MPSSTYFNSDEVFRLKWENSQGVVDLVKIFQDFREKEELFDVKLGCPIIEGGSGSVRAHKLVLSAYSPVFKDMFDTLKDNIDPFIYLKGVSEQNLTSILDFMYQGSVDIRKSNLDSFLSDAEDLQIKGLKLNSHIDNNTEKITIHPEIPNKFSNPVRVKSFKKVKRVKEEPAVPIFDNQSFLEREISDEDDDYQLSNELKRGKRQTKERRLEVVKKQVQGQTTNYHPESFDNYSEFLPKLKEEEIVSPKNFPSGSIAPKRQRIRKRPRVDFDKRTLKKENIEIDGYFEEVNDKWITRGDNRKRHISRCNICSKELRRDKRKQHLRSNHPNEIQFKDELTPMEHVNQDESEDPSTPLEVDNSEIILHI